MRLTSLAIAAAALVLPAAALSFDNILVILFENTRYEDTIVDPNFRDFAKQGVLFSNWTAASHPSQPNYIYLTSGSTHGVNSDDLVTIEGKNLADILEEKHLTWKAYEEGFPGDCFLGINAGKWAQKHSGFLFYGDVHSNRKRCANIVDATHFKSDIERHKLPNFVWYTPDLNNDAHDTNVTFAGKWLKGFLHDTRVVDRFDVVFITFDESIPDNNNNHVYTAMAGRVIKNRGFVDNTRLDHGSLLKTLEHNFRLNSLNRNDTTATPFCVW